MIRRRGLLAICLLVAGAAAFRRRRFQPNWSFRRSADWVIARTPTRYGDALRTIRKCMDCDALVVSLQNHSISLTNATLSLDDEEALRVERLEVVVESYSPLIVSAALGTVQVSVEAHDLLLRDTNWHRLNELEEAFTQLSPSSSAFAAVLISPSSSAHPRERWLFLASSSSSSCRLCSTERSSLPSPSPLYPHGQHGSK